MPRFVKGSKEAKAWGKEMAAKNNIPYLKKGSPEAKERMSKLRAMRGKNKLLKALPGFI